MTDREALAAALDHLENNTYTNYSEAEVRGIVYEAVRERLAQLPRTCDTCNGDKQIYAGGTHAEWGPCPTCHGTGKVYPAELVERLQKLIMDTPQGSIAVAVLDVLNETTT